MKGVGYLLKDRVSEVEEFIAGAASRGRRRVRTGSDDRVDNAETAPQLRPPGVLTPREREVLELMAIGASNAGIAESMVITQRAAEKYVSTIFTKLGIPATGSESRRCGRAALPPKLTVAGRDPPETRPS